MENEIQTKYGKIVLINENGMIKVDFYNCTFNSANNFLNFLFDEFTLKEITGY